MVLIINSIHICIVKCLCSFPLKGASGQNGSPGIAGPRGEKVIIIYFIHIYGTVLTIIIINVHTHNDN